MGDYINSILQHVNAKAKTQLFGVFSIWWVILHADYFITLFLVEQSIIFEKYRLLKNEYLHQEFFKYGTFEFWARFMTPFVMTWFTIWIFHRHVVNRAYKKEKENDYRRQEIKFKYDKDVESLKQRKLEKQETTLKKMSTVIEKEKEIDENAKYLWESEYRELSKLPLVKYFENLIESLYSHGGKVRVIDAYDELTFEINRDILAYADTNGLIEYNREKQLISLTEKGKYFVKRYQSEPRA